MCLKKLMRTYLENPSQSEMVALMEARYVANHHNRRTEVRKTEKGFVIMFPSPENEGTLISTRDPIS